MCRDGGPERDLHDFPRDYESSRYVNAMCRSRPYSVWDLPKIDMEVTEKEANKSATMLPFSIEFYERNPAPNEGAFWLYA